MNQSADNDPMMETVNQVSAQVTGVASQPGLSPNSGDPGPSQVPSPWWAWTDMSAMC